MSDCEGPISKNDNAFEATSNFVPNGNRLFTVVSRYDDVLAEVERRPGYNAGDTLKLVLPFLKAYGVTDQQMRRFAAKNLVCIASIKEVLQCIRRLAPTFVVSTSYEHYLRALCQSLEFPFENTYCTRLSLDKYELPDEEKGELKQIVEEITQMPIFDITSDAKSLDDLPRENREVVQQLDEIFWERIAKMDIGRIYSEVNPVGGGKKAEIIENLAGTHHVALCDLMYVGDSITDEEAFKLVKNSGGLTVSFNGNQHAVENAEVAILSENSVVTGIVADVFLKCGKAETMMLVENWDRKALKESQIDKGLRNLFFKVFPDSLPKVEIISSQNLKALVEESNRFRNNVRGRKIARLG